MRFFMHTLHKVVNMHEAKTYFSQLVNAVMEGKEILIAKAGVPVARLLPIKPKKKKIKFGMLKGKIKISKDFDEYLNDDVIKLFEGT